MAGIEKVCEYSGEYCGGIMYTWKRNFIQIKPEFRKLFKGCECELFIEKAGLNAISKNGCFVSIKDQAYYELNYINWGLEDEVRYHKERGYRVAYEYVYTLKVYDEKLQGKVGGRYAGYTFDRKAVIRRLKRLTGNSNLKVNYIN